MNDIVKEKIVQISQKILEHIIEFRSANPGFTVSLRKRDSVQSEEKRLENGQWFQGAEYIYVPLFRKGDTARKIKTLGFVLTFDKLGNIKDNFVEISFKDGVKDENEISFHKELAKKLNITLNEHNHGAWHYTDFTNYIVNLDDYLKRVYPMALDLIGKYKLSSSYVVDEKSFTESLERITEIKKNLKLTKYIDMDLINHVYPQSLNQIIFGPPGVGKTYNTINKALEILGDNISNKARKEVKKIYDRRVAEGRIQFSTFHQSMSYEDFIEGIKPRIFDNQIIYEVEDGVFKKICAVARVVSGNFEEIIEQFKKDISELDGKTPLKIASAATSFDIIFRGTNVFYVQPHNTVKENPWYPVNIQNIRKALETESYQGIYNPTYVREVINFLRKNYGLKRGLNEKPKELKPYVLIIDEINRGNISQIFGELITLIEDDKREGAKESLSVILPYSKEFFSVPSNLYIVGTMNTADRSVEALDTALRRRFVFEEKSPDVELLIPERMVWQLWWDYYDVDWNQTEYKERETELYKLLGFPKHLNNEKEKEKFWKQMKAEGINKKQIELLSGIPFSGINLARLLSCVNNRIEKLLGKDNKIGHAYLINIGSIYELKNAFQYKILPLLQEYFFGDYGRIGLVIGEVFIKDLFIEKSNTLMPVVGYESGDLNEVIVYKMQNIFKWEESTFLRNVKAIYGE